MYQGQVVGSPQKRSRRCTFNESNTKLLNRQQFHTLNIVREPTAGCLRGVGAHGLATWTKDRMNTARSSVSAIVSPSRAASA